MATTNAEIINLHTMELIIDGKISPNEDIHTYAWWKSKGHQVKKGEKAVASFKIWKPVKDRRPDADPDKPVLILCKAHFFATSQVQ